MPLVDILEKAADTIQRLGSDAQDCKSCANLTMCNAYKDGDSLLSCNYKWIHAAETDKLRTIILEKSDNHSDWYE